MKKLIAVTAALVLVLAVVCTAAAEGKTVTALYPKTDIYNLKDKFVTTDIALKEGSKDIAVFTLYERERFDEDAVRNVVPGDVIVTGGESVEIKTIDVDGPDFIFNKGTPTEMLFCDAGKGTFEHVGLNDIVPDIKLGSIEVELLDYFPFLDWIDPKSGEPLEQVALRSGEELRTLLADSEAVGFSSGSVRVLYDNNNQPQMIWRFYSPLQ